jgi:hypothetical protein
MYIFYQLIVVEIGKMGLVISRNGQSFFEPKFT